MKYDITIIPFLSITSLSQNGVKHYSFTPKEMFNNFIDNKLKYYLTNDDTDYFSDIDYLEIDNKN